LSSHIINNSTYLAELMMHFRKRRVPMGEEGDKPWKRIIKQCTHDPMNNGKNMKMSRGTQKICSYAHIQNKSEKTIKKYISSTNEKRKGYA